MTVTTDQYLKTIARELGRIAHALEAIATKNDPSFSPVARGKQPQTEASRTRTRQIDLEEEA